MTCATRADRDRGEVPIVGLLPTLQVVAPLPDPFSDSSRASRYWDEYAVYWPHRCAGTAIAPPGGLSSQILLVIYQSMDCRQSSCPLHIKCVRHVPVLCGPSARLVTYYDICKYLFTSSPRCARAYSHPSIHPQSCTYLLEERVVPLTTARLAHEVPHGASPRGSPRATCIGAVS